MSWKNVVNLNTVELKAAERTKNYHYEWTALSPDMGAKKLGFNVSLLQPGDFSCPYHFHHSEEELFLVLEGKAMLRQANQYREVTQGDLMFFSNSPEGAHQLYNHTDQPFRYLALSTKETYEVCEYPDSRKVSVSKIRKILQDGVEVEYLKDEENPARYWPKEHLSPHT